MTLWHILLWISLKLLYIAAPAKPDTSGALRPQGPRCWQVRLEMNWMWKVFIIMFWKVINQRDPREMQRFFKIWNGFCGDFRNTEECPFVILSKCHISLLTVVNVRFYWVQVVQHSSAYWSPLFGFMISVILFMYDY